MATAATTAQGGHGDDPLRQPGPADEDGQRRAEQGQHDGQRARRCGSLAGHSLSTGARDVVPSASAAELGPVGRSACLLVGDLLVAHSRRAADGPVGDVVLDLVVVGQQPAAVGQGEQEGGDAEA